MCSQLYSLFPPDLLEEQLHTCPDAPPCPLTESLNYLLACDHGEDFVLALNQPQLQIQPPQHQHHDLQQQQQQYSRCLQQQQSASIFLHQDVADAEAEAEHVQHVSPGQELCQRLPQHEGHARTHLVQDAGLNSLAQFHGLDSHHFAQQHYGSNDHLPRHTQQPHAPHFVEQEGLHGNIEPPLAVRTHQRLDLAGPVTQFGSCLHIYNGQGSSPLSETVNTQFLALPEYLQPYEMSDPDYISIPAARAMLHALKKLNGIDNPFLRGPETRAGTANFFGMKYFHNTLRPKTRDNLNIGESQLNGFASLIYML